MAKDSTGEGYPCKKSWQGISLQNEVSRRDSRALAFAEFSKDFNNLDPEGVDLRRGDGNS
jgi:hypothetical protein